MSRIIGEFVMNTNYDVSVQKPFDARMLVPTYADLSDENNWYKYDPATQSLTNIWIAYNGMIVAVANMEDTSKNGIYMLFDSSNKKKPSVVAENWTKLADLNELNELSARIDALELEIDYDELINNLKDTFMSFELINNAKEFEIVDGTLAIKELSLNKVIQDEATTLILNGGNAI